MTPRTTRVVCLVRRPGKEPLPGDFAVEDVIKVGPVLVQLCAARALRAVADVLELVVAAMYARELDRFALLQGVDIAFQLSRLVMHELRRCNRRVACRSALKVWLLQNLHSHVGDRLARLHLPPVWNACGR